MSESNTSLADGLDIGDSSHRFINRWEIETDRTVPTNKTTENDGNGF